MRSGTSRLRHAGVCRHPVRDVDSLEVYSLDPGVRRGDELQGIRQGDESNSNNDPGVFPSRSAYYPMTRHDAADLARRLATLPRPTYPDDLPVVARRDEIAQAIAAHQVVIVCGET